MKNNLKCIECGKEYYRPPSKQANSKFCSASCRNKHLSKTKRKLDMGIWFYSVLGGRDNDLNKVGYINGSCKVAETVCNHIINFPTHLRINENLFNELIDKNIGWIKNNIINPNEIIRDK